MLSAVAHGKRWRRAFCAMLAGRGPVYRTAEAAGLGIVYHEFCGCTVEESLTEWEPTDREREYRLLEERTRPGSDAIVLAPSRKAAFAMVDSRWPALTWKGPADDHGE